MIIFLKVPSDTVCQGATFFLLTASVKTQKKKKLFFTGGPPPLSSPASPHEWQDNENSLVEPCAYVCQSVSIMSIEVFFLF